jgi:hypothetical protein
MVTVVPLIRSARKRALVLSALALATAVPAASASTVLAQSAGGQVEQPDTRTTQSDLPQIPQVAGDYQQPPDTSSTETPEVAGEQPETTPPAEETPAVVKPAVVVPQAQQPSGDTLPVTGLDLMIILGAAAAAGGVGFALRRSASR